MGGAGERPAGRATKVAAAVGAAFVGLGVDTAFGVLGSGNFVATEAFVAAGGAFHAARHEGGAASMADGFARVSGRPALVSVHQGPGLTNAITAIGEAAKARVPMVVFAGDTAPGALRSNFRIDQHALVESVGARAERLHDAGSAVADAARALARARDERRPVVLMAPVDLQEEPFEGAAPATAAPAPLPAGASPEAIAALADLLLGARRPLVIAGRGAVVADAGGPLAELGERAGAMLATTAMAKGLFAGHPHHLGISGGFSSPPAAELIAGADLVLAVGASLTPWTTREGSLFAAAEKLVRIDVEADAAVGEGVDLVVLGDAAAVAAALCADLAERGRERRVDPEIEAAAGRCAWRLQRFDADPGPGRIDPRSFSIALEESLPAERTVVVDSGHFLGWPAMFLEPPDARSWVFVNAFQAVGLGLGAAIGAAVARPDRLTVLAIGDGGLQMSLPELETAARLGLPLLIAVYDDDAYGAEVHPFGAAGHDVSLVRFPEGDLAAVARAAGLGALTVREAADLEPVAAWAAAPDGPLLVDAKVDPAVCAEWLSLTFEGEHR
jgi:thiamine pyrophosphate-dependent acetolactate synthase large subunit-like protein